MKAFPTLAGLALALGLAQPAAAQPKLKAGLWEMQHRMQGNAQMDQAMEQMRKQLEAMPAEQRRQMEAMMAGRGMQMGGMGGGGMTMRVCLTQEMVDRDNIPATNGDCTTSSQQRTGGTIRVAFSCTRPPSSGESEVTLNGSESFTTKTRATTTAGGKSETVTIEGSGKWLSADCGSVKPLAPPPAR